MKWLIVTEDFPPDFIGGIASWAHDLATALHNHGEQVTVMARNTRNSWAFDQQSAFPIRRVYGRNWGKYGHIWMALAQRLQAEADIIFAATWELARWLSNAKTRLWVACHGSDITRPDLPIAQLQKMSTKVEHWFPVSHALGQLLSAYVPQARPHVLPMPLSIPSTPPTTRSADSPLLSAGRLVPSKAIPKVIAIAKLLHRPLWIIGDGPLQSQLQQEYASARILFLGRLTRSEVRAKMRLATACFLLSEEQPPEGLGLCLLEAAAEGCIPVGSTSGGIPEAIGGGLLIDPLKPDMLAIQALLQNPMAGQQCYTWLRNHHGPAHTLACLLSLAQAKP